MYFTTYFTSFAVMLYSALILPTATSAFSFCSLLDEDGKQLADNHQYTVFFTQKEMQRSLFSSPPELIVFPSH